MAKINFKDIINLPTEELQNINVEDIEDDDVDEGVFFNFLNRLIDECYGENTIECCIDSEIVDTYDAEPELVEYLTNIIESEYSNVDKAHDKRHIYQVTNCAMYLGNAMYLDTRLCFAIGALHDIGLQYGDREYHHINSAKWVESHKWELFKFFTEDEIDIITTAVKEHRSSGNTKSNIYSELISDADKIPTHNINDIIRRTYLYTKEHTGKSGDELFDLVFKHIHEKYGKKDIYGNLFYTNRGKIIMSESLDKIIKYTNDPILARELYDEMNLENE